MEAILNALDLHGMGYLPKFMTPARGIPLLIGLSHCFVNSSVSYIYASGGTFTLAIWYKVSHVH